jgi:hypothetical protein
MGHKQTLEQASGDVRFTYESGHAPSRPEMSAKCQQLTFQSASDWLASRLNASRRVRELKQVKRRGSPR